MHWLKKVELMDKTDMQPRTAFYMFRFLTGLISCPMYDDILVMITRKKAWLGFDEAKCMGMSCWFGQTDHCLNPWWQPPPPTWGILKGFKINWMRLVFPFSVAFFVCLCSTHSKNDWRNSWGKLRQKETKRRKRKRAKKREKREKLTKKTERERKGKKTEIKYR